VDAGPQSVKVFASGTAVAGPDEAAADARVESSSAGIASDPNHAPRVRRLNIG
jgi:hypothetical protein